MVKSELRIGNIVKSGNQWHNSEYAIVGELHSEYLLHDSFDVHGKPYVAVSHYPDTKGIPITEEWLIKFGFNKPENLEEIDRSFTKQVGYRHKNDLGEREYAYVISSEVDEYSCYYYVTKEIEYVHQLQNLYFALTGEELCVK